MKGFIVFSFILDCVIWLRSLIRLCMGIGNVDDWIILFFTTGFVIHCVDKLVKSNKEKTKAEEQGDDPGQGDGSVVP